MKCLVSMAAVLVLALGAFAQQTAVATDVTARIAALAEKARVAERIPGLTVAVRTADGSMWSRGFGLADLENDVPATEHTSYRLASISKPMTAVVVMQLVEQRRLDLDAAVSSILREFPEKRWKVTPRQLLGHLGGVRHYDRDGRETMLNRHYDDVVEALEIFADDELLHEPGTRYRYSTYGYNLLGAVAQRAAGRSFEDLLRARVFEPAGMTATRVDDAWAIIPHRAQGYRLRRGEIVNAYPVDTSNKVPGGGLCGTALDLVKFGTAMLGEELVSAKTRELMWTSQKTADDKATGYGLGFGVGKGDLGPFVGHGGSQPRVQTLLRIWPESGIVVSVMCNLQGAKLAPLVNDAGEVLHEER